MKSVVGWIAVLSLVALADCGGGEGAGNSSCRGIANLQAECGVLVGGNTQCHAQPERDVDACLADCMNSASCNEVVNYACSGSTNACMNNCLFVQSFQCSNGNTVEPIAQCDGVDDCGNGSDEVNCEVSIFRCSEFQAQKIDGSLVCDGNDDCGTGLDEEDCGTLTCF